MKVVLFCGGQGLRLREEGRSTAKPLALIGQRPVLWHLMSYYASFGHRDFVLCLGHRSEEIKRYFLEYDDPRSGSFEPLRYLAKGKIVVLGLVTTKLGQLEPKDMLKRRIEEAAKIVPLDQLCLSPQCGFSSTVHGNELMQEQQAAKMRLVIDVARDVWGAA